MRKYEFTGETKVVLGIRLYRIKALIDISAHGVVSGDLGGWIAKESNLSHCGDAWVCGNAQVSGNARVSDNAHVSGNAQVYGDARVYGDAQVSGNARVYGDAWDKSPLQIQGTKYMFYAASKNKIGIGCQIHTYAAWHKCWRKVADEHNFTVDEQREYIMYFNIACELYGKQKYKVSVPMLEKEKAAPTAIESDQL